LDSIVALESGIVVFVERFVVVSHPPSDDVRPLRERSRMTMMLQPESARITTPLTFLVLPP